MARSQLTATFLGENKMPCSDPFGRIDLDKITDMLCRCCLVLEVAGAIFPLDIKEWWENHKKIDEKRKR